MKTKTTIAQGYPARASVAASVWIRIGDQLTSVGDSARSRDG